MQLPIKIELNFDEEFINLLKELKPKRGGIYAKAYKELLNDIIAAYHHTRKGMKAKVIGGDDNNKLKEENSKLNKALDKAIKLIVKAVEYNEATCILGDGDCPVANGICTSINDKYKCEQEECWREYFTS